MKKGDLVCYAGPQAFSGEWCRITAFHPPVAWVKSVTSKDEICVLVYNLYVIYPCTEETVGFNRFTRILKNV